MTNYVKPNENLVDTIFISNDKTKPYYKYSYDTVNYNATLYETCTDEFSDK